MLRITITFSYGGVQTIDCDKMMRSLRYKGEVMGMFREKDKPKDPQRRWQPFYTVNMAHVASLHRIELPGGKVMPTVERGYVLFDETSQMYIRLHETLGYGLLTWTLEPKLAVMFVRGADAEAFNKLHNLHMRVIHHEQMIT